MSKKKGSNVMGVAGERLLSFIERIERLEEEKKAISDDISEVKREAKGAGFDVKTINKIIRERKLSSEQRAEEEALLDIYRAALGMLHDTPLGEAARRRLSKPGDENPEQEKEKPGITAEQIEEAKTEGAQAAQDGKPVTDNPFPAGDPRRAAWDEAWCKASGSDGMDIPSAWKRQKPAPKKDDEDQNKGGKK